MKEKTILSLISFIIFSVLALPGCSDNVLMHDDDTPSGLDTKVGIRVVAPQMAVHTRADMSPALLNRINNLWIGIYNSRTGALTASKRFENLNGNNDTQAEQSFNLDTKSGPSYIVAVANYNSTAYGVGIMGADGTVTTTTMSAALDAADTWDKYRAIVIRQFTVGNINMPNPPIAQGLLMTGFFISDNGTPGSDLNHTQAALEQIESVTIPYSENSSTTLGGAIHLSRPFAQVKVNIQLSGTTLEYFDLTDIQMINVPRYSWALARTGESNPETGAPMGERLSYTNASDAVAGNFANASSGYAQSLRYIPTAMDTEEVPEDNGVAAHTRYSMDFWMFDNRHTGLAMCQQYSDREREYNTDGSNTGVYQSLSSASATLNNTASYLRIRGEMKYKESVSLADYGVQERIAEVEYVVHLGYVNPSPDPKDFNVLRNSIYTYNITVAGADNIYVEAHQENGELAPQPGAEGVVTDVTDESFELDAHYGAFNIYLSEDELSDCSFSMTSYYGNNIYNFTNSNSREEYPLNESDPRWKFYNWVELRKTTSADVLASYPSESERNGDNPIYYLADLKTKTLSEGYYTVFVNEYTYEDSSNEGADWNYYVNLPERRFWIRVTESVSPDGQSVYSSAKYAISQKSIQTFYDDASPMALGIEHSNENFGMNQRWTGAVASTDFDSDNGRYNVWSQIGGTDGGSQAGNWTSYIQPTVRQYINAINHTEQTTAAGVSSAARNVAVPMMSLLSGQTATEYDPQDYGNDTQFYEVMMGCMNRNRDLNGNGVIDADELRWYLPSTGEYVRVVLGRTSYETPIINFTAPKLPYTDGYLNSFYHFVASDYRYIWAEEGLSTSAMNEVLYGAYPWEIRCVRNLGTNLGHVSRSDNLVQAYVDDDYDPQTLGGVVKVPYYYGISLRAIEPDYIPMHKINSLYNRVGMYGFEVAPRGNNPDYFTTPPANIEKVNEMPAITTDDGVAKPYGDYTSYLEAVMDASNCADLNNRSGRTGWRVPNQVELVIMRRMANQTMLGGYAGLNSFYENFMSCTQEYWSNSTGIGSPITGSNFRFATVKPGLATAQPFLYIYLVRCVRDLTAQEQDLTYQQIISQ